MEEVTIKDIAKICGVGVSTVSRAINNHPDINRETKQMIMDTIAQYGYIPNNSARNLKRADSNAIGVLIKGIYNPFFTEMIGVLEKEIKQKKYSFILHQVDEEEEEVEVAIQLEKEKRLKGIIFLGGRFSHQQQSLRRLSAPFVLTTVNMELPNDMTRCACVSIDDEKESYRLVTRLIEMGHRRIVILAAAEKDESVGHARLAGYRKALEDNGIAYDPELVVRLKKDLPTYSLENGYETTKDLISSGKEFSCIYAISDTLAIGACRALADGGICVPKDCAVAGFDGMQMSAYYSPSITTVCQPCEEMAKESIRTLFQMIQEEPAKRKQIFEAPILVRESTGWVNGN